MFPLYDHIVVRPMFELTKLGLKAPYMVVSIGDPFDPDVRIPWSWKLQDVLRVRFADVDLANSSTGMETKHARLIWDFIERHKDIRNLVVHCVVGVSRSPSVAMAIADCTGNSRHVIQWERDPCGAPPNKRVYDTLCDEWLHRRSYVGSS
jgi:predicted protein tyrosine phosphatase